jgi:CHAT domain-containing protein/tetratricopeptide (TPR) repeat protein
MSMFRQYFQFRAILLFCCGAGVIANALALPTYSEPASQAIPTQSTSATQQEDIGALIKKAQSFYGNSNFSAAAEIWEKVIQQSVGFLGKEHPAVAEAINNLGLVYLAQGDYSKAEKLLIRSLVISEKALGASHLNVAATLSSLGRVYKMQGDFSRAEQLLSRSLAIKESALGPGHPGVAKALSNLAGLYKVQGQFDKAEQLYFRSIAIQKKALGNDNLNIAFTLNNLAELYEVQGLFDKAEQLYIRSLAIRKKAPGTDDIKVANGLNSLGGFYISKGSYGKAESLLTQSLEIRQKALGADSLDVADSLNDLAAVYFYQAQYSKAERLYLRALAIREKALSPYHIDVAESLSNLGSIYACQLAYDKAEPLLLRSLAIQEKVLAPDHLDIATSLNNLANIYSTQGQAGKAESLYVRSLAIREKVLGPNKRVASDTLNNLANLYRDQGQYGKAEPLYLRSIAIQEEVLGASHPDLAIRLASLAEQFLAQDDYQRGISYLDRSLTIQSTWLRKELIMIANQARSTQLIGVGKGWLLPFSIANVNRAGAVLALTTRLNREGLLQEIEQRQILLARFPGVNRDLVEQLRTLTTQLASVSIPSERRAALREERDQLQAKLYRASPELEIKPVSTEDITKAMPADGALIEFQRYKPFAGHNPPNQQWGELRYLALILKPDGSIQPVQLGPAAPIDAAVQKGLTATAQNQSDSKAIWEQLSDLVLLPLLSHLKGSRQWFLSPDGELNRVPFAALPSPQQSGIPLAEAVQLRQLSTGRELLRLQQPAAKGHAPVVFANPDYGHTVQIARKATTTTEQPIAQQRSSDLGAKTWSPLPATALEGQRVATLLSASLLTGSDASATRLEQQQSPRILHVATHGFFVADAVSKPQDPLRLIQDQAPQLNALRQEDPQLRSGLVLAGANQPDSSPNDDGYLTAAEAVTLNLKGTELVVLSACSTGQGDIRTGEGVYGLQRSLAVAGARSTLLSLWKVDDAATQEFMTRFYKRLKAGEARADALAAVQKDFRAGIPGRPDWKEPYYWAAWQLVGDWRPIKGL